MSRLVIPREHGAWMMWIGPLVIGVLSAPWNGKQLLLAVAALFAYLASYPLLQGVKQPRYRRRWWTWAAGYGGVAAVAGAALLAMEPGLAGVALGASAAFLANVWFAVRRQERHLLNDLLAMAGLSLTGVAAYRLGRGAFDAGAWMLWLVCVVYFFGSALHVKSMIRERRNRGIKWAANLYAVVAPLVIGPVFGWTASAAFLAAAVRAWATRQERPPQVLALGLIEIGASIWFVLWMILWIRTTAVFGM
ncbi:MAG: YwiC-like family protein [Alicyclobacillaceae bacterium]|nr:YwiC-like family protein [Alicyclobacillaceae bacterium]